MIEQDQKLNDEYFNEIHPKMIEGDKHISKRLVEEALMIIGPSGAGKSTVTNVMMGRPLLIQQDKYGELTFCNEEGQTSEPLVATNAMQSKTQFPIEVDLQVDNQQFKGVDTIGGYDHAGLYKDILNKYFNSRELDIIQKVKFVLVDTFNSVSETKGNNFVNSILNFAGMFSRVDILKESVSLVVTKVPTKKNKDNVCAYISDISESNQRLKSKDKELIGYLLEKVTLLHLPESMGSFTDDMFLPNVWKGMSYLNLNQLQRFPCDEVMSPVYIRDLITITIPEQAVPIGEQLFDKAKTYFDEGLYKLNARIETLLNEINSVHNKKMPIKDRVKPVKEMWWDRLLARKTRNTLLGSSIQEKNIEMKDMEVHFSKLLDIEDMCVLEETHEAILSDGINVEKVFECKSCCYRILSKHLKKDERQKLADEERELDEKVQTLKFFEKVCLGRRAIDYSLIKDLFLKSYVKLKDAKDRGVTSITTVPAGAHYEFYDRLRVEFNKKEYTDKPEIKPLRAHCEFFMGKIRQDEGQLDAAINHYRDAATPDVRCLLYPEIYDYIIDLTIIKKEPLAKLSDYKQILFKVFEKLEELVKDLLNDFAKLVNSRVLAESFASKYQTELDLLDDLDELRLKVKFMMRYSQTVEQYDAAVYGFQQILECKALALVAEQKSLNALGTRFRNLTKCSAYLVEIYPNPAYHSKINGWFVKHIEKTFKNLEGLERTKILQLKLSSVKHNPNDLYRAARFFELLSKKQESRNQASEALRHLAAFRVKHMNPHQTQEEFSNQEKLLEAAVKLNNGNLQARRDLAEVYKSSALTLGEDDENRNKQFSLAIDYYKSIGLDYKITDCFDRMIKKYDCESEEVRKLNAITYQEYAKYYLDNGLYNEALKKYYNAKDQWTEANFYNDYTDEIFSVWRKIKELNELREEPMYSPRSSSSQTDISDFKDVFSKKVSEMVKDKAANLPQTQTDFNDDKFYDESTLDLPRMDDYPNEAKSNSTQLMKQRTITESRYEEKNNEVDSSAILIESCDYSFDESIIEIKIE